MNHSRVRNCLTTLLLLGLMSCGGSGDGPTTTVTPVPTSITIDQNSVTLTFIGATVTLTARIRDQTGQPFAGTVTWSSADPSVASIDGAGLLTALQNGTVSISATSGSLSANLTVTVEQLASLLSIISGEDQIAPVGQALGEALVVQAADAGNTIVAGTNLSFVVSSGGGMVDMATVATDSDGLASVIWTLGTIAGLQQVDITIEGSTSPLVQASATGLPGAADALAKLSGDLQDGVINLPLGMPIVVRLEDEFGNGVAGGEVTFAATVGGGAANPTPVTTGAAGTASTVWTMGPTLGAATLTATATGFPAVTFTATAGVPTADLVPGAISVAPANPTSIETLTVTVPVTNVGTFSTVTQFPVRLLVDGAEASTQMVGPLTPSESIEVVLMAGPLATGTRALSVVVDPDGAVGESDETNNTALQSVAVVDQTALEVGVPINNVGAAEGVELLFGFQLPAEAGSIEFRLTSNEPSQDADMFVNHAERPVLKDDYECKSLTAESNESCQFNNALTGTYHVLIHAFSEFSGATLTVTTGVDATFLYDIELVFINSGTALQNAAFETAANRWEAVLPYDLREASFEQNPGAANTCLQGQPVINDVVDDLRIYVDIIPIDGVGSILGQAGWCFIRTFGSLLPVIGIMQFDSADLASLEASGGLIPVILHEMGHVLGVGSLWSRLGLLMNPSANNPGADTYFSGPLAIEAFNAAGGNTYTGGMKVPVENSGTPGSTDSHWRESLLVNELMTPQLNNGFNPLSAITIQALADVGYRVDVGVAETFNRVFTQPATAAERAPLIDLSGDTWQGPLIAIDEQGRVVEVIRR